MAFDKVTSNEDLSVGLKSITIFIFILCYFTKTYFSRVANSVKEGIEEQRVRVKFCLKLGKSLSETFELL
jgi:hypothetical protein